MNGNGLSGYLDITKHIFHDMFFDIAILKVIYFTVSITVNAIIFQ